MYKSTPFLTNNLFFHVLIYETFGGKSVAQRLPEEIKDYHSGKLQVCFGIKARYGLNNRTLSVCTTHMNACILYFVLTDTFHHHLHLSPPLSAQNLVLSKYIHCFSNGFPPSVKKVRCNLGFKADIPLSFNGSFHFLLYQHN